MDVACIEHEADVARGVGIVNTRLQRDGSIVRHESALWSGTRQVGGPAAVRRTRYRQIPRRVPSPVRL